MIIYKIIIDETNSKYMKFTICHRENYLWCQIFESLKSLATFEIFIMSHKSTISDKPLSINRLWKITSVLRGEAGKNRGLILVSKGAGAIRNANQAYVEGKLWIDWVACCAAKYITHYCVKASNTTPTEAGI